MTAILRRTHSMLESLAPAPVAAMPSAPEAAASVPAPAGPPQAQQEGAVHQSLQLAQSAPASDEFQRRIRQAWAMLRVACATDGLMRASSAAAAIIRRNSLACRHPSCLIASVHPASMPGNAAAEGTLMWCRAQAQQISVLNADMTI